MRNLVKSILAIVIVLTGFGNLYAQNKTSKTEEFKVYGNCGMCEARIEKAAKSLDGVSTADWNKETKMMEVTYDPAKIEVMDIHKAIAKVGHDTDKVKTDDKVYDELPGCCQYERKNMMKDDGNHDGHHH
ncbi:MAG: heavy-metal-associated domain-containing protein [Bacteroidales bacterium]|jgi:copper chaperone CopZ|nr:cation transporter [Bacteroidales bacterium]NCU34450.1 copper chaperone [Candidatus Falkowbacteria bacterium]MDD2631149.1 heavy-metal-associated domain-containing protein [Bacteroidales bacterium]MDD3130384.1 heavy-metal-associated domain-containing protein [Bacteroidales bacterium]MDD3528072.1 heavy-metal-associated domain-containing protein [Bacteroidales bacterium]